MESNTLMIIYGGLAILVIFYFVVSFFSGKTWKVTHVLIAVSIFFASAVFLVFAAQTLKTHQAWREVYLTKAKELAEQKVENDLLFKGYARDAEGNLLPKDNDDNFDPKEDSIRLLTAQLGQELYDRARVWRGCMPGDFDGTSVTVTVSPPPDGGAAPDDLAITDQAILYAFKEFESPEGWKLPRFFLGEFRVTAKTPTTITLSPTIPLDTAQQAEIQNRNSTWVLYDLMPVDSYYAFAEMYDSDAADPEGNFRDKLQQLMPPSRMNLTGEIYDQLVDQYARDRREAKPTDPKDRIWKKVRFLKVHEIKVDAEPESAKGALRYYDASGRAVPASLRYGEFNPDTGEFVDPSGEIEFDIGDVALLDSKTVDGYVDPETEERVQGLLELGVCEELESVYIRELRDYAYEFHEIYGRLMGLNDHAVRIKVDTDSLVLAHTGAEKTVTYRSGEQDSLLADIKGTEEERDALRDYLTQLTVQWQQLQKDLSLLYRTNNSLVAQIERYQASLSQMINQRTGQAESTAQSPEAPEPPTSPP